MTERTKDTTTGHTRVSDEARGALITAVGIILGFALTAAATWAGGPEGWRPADRGPGLALGAGVLLLVAAMYRALLPLQQEESWYRTTIWIFLVGIAVTFAGVAWSAAQPG